MWICAAVLALSWYMAIKMAKGAPNLKTLFLFSLALRMLFLLIWPVELSSDFKFYFDVAKDYLNIPVQQWKGIVLGPYLQEQWPALMPYILYQALMIRAFGVSVGPLLAVNALASSASVTLVYLIARDILDERRGWKAGCLLAANPCVLFMISLLTSQHLALCFMLMALWLLLRKRGVLPSRVGAGICLAVSQLFRPECAVFLIAYGLYCACVGIKSVKMGEGYRELGKKAGRALAVCLTYQACMTGVDVWFQSYGFIQQSLLSTNMAYKLLVGLNANSTGIYNTADAQMLADAPGQMAGEILNRLSNVGRTLRLLLQKLWSNLFGHANGFSFYGRPTDGFQWQTYVAVTCGYMAMVTGHAFRALYHRIRKGHFFSGALSLVFWIWFGYLCAFTLLETQPRYLFVMYPFVSILAVSRPNSDIYL